MMLITPATAAEPYTAEAPSRKISIRSTIAIGIREVSADAPEEVLVPGIRRPSNSTRVASEPKPRKLMLEVAEEPAP